jgi:transcriptional regulator with XRE-family HTH domain
MNEYGAPMELNARIFHARKEAGLSQEALAVAVGKTRGAVAQWESGDVHPRPATLAAIAKATGKSLSWLQTGEDSGGLSVIGEVAAGVWKEAGAYYVPHRVPVAPDPNYPPEAQRLYKVTGTSVNRMVAHGEFVHCISVERGGIRFESGDLVIVRRIVHGMAEYTAKISVWENGRWILRPASDDEQWQQDIELGSDDSAEITVTDIVIAKWTPIGRARST